MCQVSTRHEGSVGMLSRKKNRSNNRRRQQVMHMIVTNSSVEVKSSLLFSPLMIAVSALSKNYTSSRQWNHQSLQQNHQWYCHLGSSMPGNHTQSTCKAFLLSIKNILSTQTYYKKKWRERCAMWVFKVFAWCTHVYVGTVNGKNGKKFYFMFCLFAPFISDHRWETWYCKWRDCPLFFFAPSSDIWCIRITSKTSSSSPTLPISLPSHLPLFLHQFLLALSSYENVFCPDLPWIMMALWHKGKRGGVPWFIYMWKAWSNLGLLVLHAWWGRVMKCCKVKQGSEIWTNCSTEQNKTEHRTKHQGKS